MTRILPTPRRYGPGIALLFWLLLAGTLWAQSPRDASGPQLLVLVSQRNAETIADAARQFHEQHPGYQIIARTDVQLWEMTPPQVQDLLSSADLVLGLGLFGATVAELEPLLPGMSTSMLFLNSDHRLIQYSQLGGVPIFDDDEQLRHVAGIQPSTDFDKTLDDLVARYPATGLDQRPPLLAGGWQRQYRRPVRLGLSAAWRRCHPTGRPGPAPAALAVSG
jgi:cobaltochelatase CobN